MTRTRTSFEQRFQEFATAATRWSGSTGVQLAAVSVFPLWLFSGMFLGLEKSWHLVFEPLTAFVPFLMVFLIQRSQNKDSMAVQLKLNELVAAIQGASNRLIDVEDLSEEDLETIPRTLPGARRPGETGDGARKVALHRRGAGAAFAQAQGPAAILAAAAIEHCRRAVSSGIISAQCPVGRSAVAERGRSPWRRAATVSPWRPVPKRQFQPGRVRSSITAPGSSNAGCLPAGAPRAVRLGLLHLRRNTIFAVGDLSCSFVLCATLLPRSPCARCTTRPLTGSATFPGAVAAFLTSPYMLRRQAPFDQLSRPSRCPPHVCRIIMRVGGDYWTASVVAIGRDPRPRNGVRHGIPVLLLSMPPSVGPRGRRF